MMNIIDIYTHVCPKEYLKELRNSCPTVELVPEEGSSWLNLIDRKTGYPFAYVGTSPHFQEIEARLKIMDKFGIDLQALSLTYPNIDASALRAQPHVCVKLAKIANDAIAEMIAKCPERFAGIAEVPIIDMDAALDEMDRAVNELGMRGFQILTTTGGKPLDAPEFLPFFERAAKYDLPILMHPANPPIDQIRSYEKDYELCLLFTWPYETTLAESRLVFSGIFDRLPGLKVVDHHLGAMIPYFVTRIAGVYETRITKSGQGKLIKGPIEYFKMIYHDTAIVGHTPSVQLGYNIFGGNRIVFSTDYPFANLQRVLASVNEAVISEEDKTKIFMENAKKLLKIG